METIDPDLTILLFDITCVMGGVLRPSSGRDLRDGLNTSSPFLFLLSLPFLTKNHLRSDGVTSIQSARGTASIPLTPDLVIRLNCCLR